MDPALVQTKAGTKTAGTGTTLTATWTSNTTTANLIVVGICTDNGTNSVTSITDSQSNVYTKITESNVSTGGFNVSLWYAKNITGGTTPTVTATLIAGTIAGMICREYSGIDTTDPLDKYAIAPDTGASASPNSGATGTQTEINNLVIGFAGSGDSSNTYTAGAGYGNAVTQGVGTTLDLGMEDKILSNSTSAQTATFSITVSSFWACAVATFKKSSVIDFYSESNQDFQDNIGGSLNSHDAQSFTGDGRQIGSAAFYINKVNSPTGSVVLQIYNSTGTHGTNATPTGAVLATSDSIDPSTLSTSLTLKTFTFSGANRITLTDGTVYVIAISTDGLTSGSSDRIGVGIDTSSPTHAGNYSTKSIGWTAISADDTCFYVYALGSAPSPPIVAWIKA